MKQNNQKEINSENIYENIKETVNIEDVVQKLPELNLIEQGNRLVGNCPTGHPSNSETCFSIDTEKNLCHCFNCGAGGSVIDLVSLALNYDIPEAVKWLMREFNLSVNIDISSLKNFQLSDEFRKNEINTRVKHQLYDEVYRYGKELLYKNENKVILDYLVSDRGYEVENLKKTEWCYFPAQAEVKEHLIKTFPNMKDEIAKLPLNGFLKDEVRLAFPYRNSRGIITGFIKRVPNKEGIKKTGRNGKEQSHRYDSSYGTKKPDLFGLDKIKMKKGDFLLILEGYPDALYFPSLGFKNVVALGQGLFSERHIKGLISKKVKNVVLALDNDQVGPKNTIRAVEILLKMSDINVFVLDQKKLDPHKDPDEYVKANGIEKFEELLSDARMAEMWWLESLMKEYDISKDISRTAGFSSAMKFSLLIRNPVTRDEYHKKIGDLFKLKKTEITAEYKRLLSEYKLERYNEEKKTFAERTREDLFPFIEKSSSSYAYYDRVDDVVTLGVSSDILGEVLHSYGQSVPETFPVLKAIFNPESDSKFNFEKNTFNLFSPTNYMLKSRTDEIVVLDSACPKIYKILCNLIPKKEERDRYLNWLAGIMQTRGKQLTAWVFVGVQGTGKNLLREHILQPIFGNRQVIQVEDGLLKSQFNGYLKNDLIICFNEVANENNTSRNSVKSKIKAIITDKEIWINEKQIREYPIDNYVNSMFFSNEGVPLVIEESDRRFNVVRTGRPLRDYEWFSRNPEGFIGGLESELESFAQFLINYNYDPILAKTVINNEEKENLVSAAMNRFEEFAMKLKEQDVEWLVENQQTNPKDISDNITLVVEGEIQGKILKDKAIEIFNKIYPNHKTDKINLTKQLRIYGIDAGRAEDMFGNRKQFYKW